MLTDNCVSKGIKFYQTISNENTNHTYFIVGNTNRYCTKKWYHVSNNDIAVMSREVVAGYSQGWRDEVQYNTKQLFRQFPNSNRSFWDIRVENPPGFLNT